MAPIWTKALFVVAGIYDLSLGAAFFVAHGEIFETFGVPPANHPAYVEFPALLLMIFGVMFLHIATDPVRLRPLIPYGVLLKASYAGLAFWYQMTRGVPAMWLPWAWVDLGFLVAFAFAWLALAPPHVAE